MTNESIVIREQMQQDHNTSIQKLNDMSLLSHPHALEQRLNLQQMSFKNMHKNANNSMIIESNQSIINKKGQQAPKVDNFVGYGTNHNISVDRDNKK